MSHIHVAITLQRWAQVPSERGGFAVWVNVRSTAITAEITGAFPAFSAFCMCRRRPSPVGMF